MVAIFSLYPALSCAVGAFLTLVIASSVSFNRSLISYKTIFSLGATHLMVGAILLKTSLGGKLLSTLIAAAHVVSDAAQAGINFLFGSLGAAQAPWGFVFAFHVLPIIVFFSAFIALLAHIGVIDLFIKGMTFIIRPLFGTLPAESACAVAKVFLGPTETHLLIQHYLKSAPRSELFAIMVSSLSMISASLFMVYIDMGIPGHHLIAANIMGIPASLLFAKIIMPDAHRTHHEEKLAELETPVAEPARNAIDALIKGALEGMQLMIAIAGILLAFIALIAMLDKICIGITSLIGWEVTFQQLIGYLCAPFGFLLGIESDQALAVSELIGIKVLANEMVAFSELAVKGLSDRAMVLATYALCGFSNLSCVGIVIGGLGTLRPERRSEVSALAGYALLAATLANLFSAYYIGIIL